MPSGCTSLVRLGSLDILRLVWSLRDLGYSRFFFLVSVLVYSLVSGFLVSVLVAKVWGEAKRDFKAATHPFL